MKDWIFHTWNEWFINFLLLFYVADFEPLIALKNFVIGYIAFISFYEIGYIVNDFYAVKKEKAPRMRFGSQQVSQFIIWLWVAIRVAIFLAISYYFHFSADWMLFYLGLGIVFALHNVLTSSALKTFTFLQLAIFRFWAPVFMFVPKSLIGLLFPVVFFYYVFNRTLTYMDSKSLLQMPERLSISFRLQASLVLLTFLLFWAYFVQSWLCVLCAVYFLLFWIIVSVLGRQFSSTS